METMWSEGGVHTAHHWVWIGPEGGEGGSEAVWGSFRISEWLPFSCEWLERTYQQAVCTTHMHTLLHTLYMYKCTAFSVQVYTAHAMRHVYMYMYMYTCMHVHACTVYAYAPSVRYMYCGHSMRVGLGCGCEWLEWTCTTSTLDTGACTCVCRWPQIMHTADVLYSSKVHSPHTSARTAGYLCLP